MHIMVLGALLWEGWSRALLKTLVISGLSNLSSRGFDSIHSLKFIRIEERCFHEALAWTKYRSLHQKVVPKQRFCFVDRGNLLPCTHSFRETHQSF